MRRCIEAVILEVLKEPRAIESVLFIGTQFSNLYTTVDTPQCYAESTQPCKRNRAIHDSKVQTDCGG
jgi:hypothetical protein